jgi:hypothetical protein
MLLRHHEFDTAVAVLTGIAAHKRGRPLDDLVLARERPARVIRPILHRPENEFRVEDGVPPILRTSR